MLSFLCYSAAVSKMSASVYPARSLSFACQGAEAVIFAESESKMFQSNWDAILQPFDTTIPACAFHEAICDGTFGFWSGDQAQSLGERNHSPLEMLCQLFILEIFQLTIREVTSSRLRSATHDDVRWQSGLYSKRFVLFSQRSNDAWLKAEWGMEAKL